MQANLRVGDETAGTTSAGVLPLGLEAKGKAAEPPSGFHVRRHHHSSAVRAVSGRLLSSQHSLLLVAHEHQAHRSLSLSLAHSAGISFISFFFVFFGFVVSDT